VGALPSIGSWWRAGYRLAALLVLTIFFTIIQAGLQAFGLPMRLRFPRWFYRQVSKLAGLRLECRGHPSHRHPTVIVSNHVSYLDIAVLGALVDARFVSRADIAAWPFIGWSAKVQGTVFVERVAQDARRHLDRVRDRLATGDNLIFFPEGTSSDGQRVLPFKSTLFAVAEPKAGDRPVQVQPVSIAYTRLDGVPMGRYLRPLFAWYGDMEFWGHLWRVLSLGKATVEVTFHEAVTLEACGNRKVLSDHCHRQVSLGLSSALSGHSQRVRSDNTAAA
jgi:1-acyl-sn-glycerol-3-phosphate acyltransferase